MASKEKPKCADCGEENTILWHNPKNPICHNCFLKNLEKSTTNPEPNPEDKKIRRSARNGAKAKAKASPVTKSTKKGKTRKVIPQKNYKFPPMFSDKRKIVDKILHDRIFYSVGDIVSLVDSKDDVFYAQIRGLIINDFCDKIAFITWLIPSVLSPPPKVCFDPSTYIIGFEDDEPRPLSHLSFVMSCPSEYFAIDMSKYPYDDDSPPRSFWRRINHEDYKRNKKNLVMPLEVEDKPEQSAAIDARSSKGEM